MKPTLKFLAARLAEPSTYRGAVLLLTGLGVAVKPELAAALTSIGLGVAGLIGMLMADPAPADPAPAAE